MFWITEHISENAMLHSYQLLFPHIYTWPRSTWFNDVTSWRLVLLQVHFGIINVLGRFVSATHITFSNVLCHRDIVQCPTTSPPPVSTTSPPPSSAIGTLLRPKHPFYLWQMASSSPFNGILSFPHPMQRHSAIPVALYTQNCFSKFRLHFFLLINSSIRFSHPTPIGQRIFFWTVLSLLFFLTELFLFILSFYFVFLHFRPLTQLPAFRDPAFLAIPLSAIPLFATRIRNHETNNH